MIVSQDVLILCVKIMTGKSFNATVVRLNFIYRILLNFSNEVPFEKLLRIWKQNRKIGWIEIKILTHSKLWKYIKTILGNLVLSFENIEKLHFKLFPSNFICINSLIFVCRFFSHSNYFFTELQFYLLLSKERLQHLKLF